MINWEKEGSKAAAIAMYSLGSISLDALAKEIGGTTLEAMQLLISAGVRSRYTLQDYRADQEILKEFLTFRPKEANAAARRAGTEHRK